MFYNYLNTILAILFGVCAGIITGLTPGIHVNLVSVLVTSSSAWLLRYFSIIDLCVFIVAMSITHVFLDMIPSIFLGAPEAETVLGVLPGHRYLLRGNGYMAVKLSVFGAFCALVISILSFPLAIFIVKKTYDIISAYIGYVLLAIVIFMIIKDNNRFWAMVVVLLSGIFGIIVFNMPNLNDPLFPMLSGLYGISTLLISLNDNQKIPNQKIGHGIELDRKKAFKAIVAGECSGFVTAVLPGVGASTAAIIAMQAAGKIGDHGFMILMGSINMVNFIISIGTLYSIGKARNGTIVAISDILGKIEWGDVLILLVAALVVAGIALWLAFKIARVFSDFIQKVDYRKLVLAIIAFIVMLAFFFTGIIGLIALIVSTSIGLIPAIKKVTRTHAMACLTVPVILYYLL